MIQLSEAFALDLFMITLMCLFTLWIVIGNKIRLSEVQKELSKIQKKLGDESA